MHLRNLLKAFVVAVALSSCANVARDYPPPDIDLGTFVYGGSCASSYGYFEPLFYEGRAGYSLWAEELAKKKYFLMSLEHYAELQKYIETLERAVKERCK